MKRLLLSIAGLVMVSASAHAGPSASVHSCDWLDSIGNLVGGVKPFAGGAIRVAHVSVDEPVAGPEHVLIFVAEEPMSRSCFAVSANADGLGFYSVRMNKLKSSYDADKGLLLQIPVESYEPEAGTGKPAGTVKIRVSRKGGVGAVTIEP